MSSEREKLFAYADDTQFKGKSTEEIFNGIYEKNIWADGESVSGPGSAMEQTQEIILKLPPVIKEYKIKTMLDIPCGDFNWMRKIDLTGVTYTGADIVNKLVETNNNKYKNEFRSFRSINLITDKLDKYDLIFCRDCLVHFSYDDINKALLNIKNSGSGYLMTTTFGREDENKNIHTGGWRPLNFEKAPFSFSKPLIVLNEKCTEMGGEFDDKALALWKIEDI